MRHVRALPPRRRPGADPRRPGAGRRHRQDLDLRIAVRSSRSRARSRSAVTVRRRRQEPQARPAAGRSGAARRSRTPPALAGSQLKVKVAHEDAGTKTLSVKVAGHAARPADARRADAALRPLPRRRRPARSRSSRRPPQATTGNAAFEAIKGYLADSALHGLRRRAGRTARSSSATRTSPTATTTTAASRCPPAATSAPYGSIAQISGAEHKADGSWGVEYYLSSYGNTVFYSWSGIADRRRRRGATGDRAATRRRARPNEQIGPLQWVRGGDAVRATSLLRSSLARTRAPPRRGGRSRRACSGR